MIETLQKNAQGVKVLEYSGHIRNWMALCQELGLPTDLTRQAREEAILIAAYKKWAGEMAMHMHGMFAFALYDEEEDQIFCLRDCFGTKTFYYYVTEDGKLLFGTQLRKILAQPGFKKELNREMLQLYLTLTYVAGEDTFFKGMKKLLPGRYMTFKNGQVNITRYWKPEYHPDESKSLEQWADEIHETFKEIMKEIKTDDEIAESFLSGGVDSAYVLSMSDAKLCNSCGYEDKRFDESGMALETANYLGIKMNRCIFGPEDYFGILPWVMENMEQPIGDASALVFALGCRATAQHTKLCYSGEGADEFFGGYNMYRNAPRYGDNLKTFYVGNTNIMKEEEKQKLLKHYYEGVLPINLVKSIYEENEGLDPLAKMCDVDIQIWLEGDIYLNIEKMSTAAGLEVRMPLTDMRIFDIASRVPSKYKVNEEQNKVALRAAAEKVLPSEIANRKKLGFIVPIRYWLADEKYNRDVFAKFNGAGAHEFFNVEELNALLQEYLGGNSDLWRKVWTVYTFLVWYDIYFG